jgi:hypothetical protein
MKLLELFNTKDIRVTIEEDEADVYIVRGHLKDGKVIRFNSSADDKPGVWNIEFSEFTKDSPNFMTKYRHDLTGTGQSFTVFGFIAQCLRHLLDTKNVVSMYCSADSEARLELYTKMLKKIPGFKVKVSQSEESGGGEITLVKA